MESQLQRKAILLAIVTLVWLLNWYVSDGFAVPGSAQKLFYVSSKSSDIQNNKADAKKSMMVNTYSGFAASHQHSSNDGSKSSNSSKSLIHIEDVGANRRGSFPQSHGMNPNPNFHGSMMGKSRPVPPPALKVFHASFGANQNNKSPVKKPMMSKNKTEFVAGHQPRRDNNHKSSSGNKRLTQVANSANQRGNFRRGHGKNPNPNVHGNRKDGFRTAHHSALKTFNESSNQSNKTEPKNKMTDKVESGLAASHKHSSNNNSTNSSKNTSTSKVATDAGNETSESGYVPRSASHMVYESSNSNASQSKNADAKKSMIVNDGSGFASRHEQSSSSNNNNSSSSSKSFTSLNGGVNEGGSLPEEHNKNDNQHGQGVANNNNILNGFNNSFSDFLNNLHENLNSDMNLNENMNSNFNHNENLNTNLHANKHTRIKRNDNYNAVLNSNHNSRQNVNPDLRQNIHKNQVVSTSQRMLNLNNQNNVANSALNVNTHQNQAVSQGNQHQSANVINHNYHYGAPSSELSSYPRYLKKSFVANDLYHYPQPHIVVVTQAPQKGNVLSNLLGGLGDLLG